MLCIGGPDSDILPYNHSWAVKHPKHHVSVLSSVLLAQSSVLQYVKMLSAADFTAVDVIAIQTMGEACCTQTLYLHQLKQAILKTKVTQYGGIKLHACINHIHSQILLFGSPKYYDTVRYEHQHAADGVAAAVQTSRRPNTISSEMLITVCMKLSFLYYYYMKHVY
jgi:hypothetical protein